MVMQMISSQPFDRDKTNITWVNDKYLYFTSQSNGGTILNRVNIKTKKEALSSRILAYQALT
jgi:hypothetical protein